MKWLVLVLMMSCGLWFGCNTSKKMIELNGEWTVITVGGKNVALTEKPSISFEGSNYHAFTGVNRVNGSFKWADGVLTIADGAMTRMAGPSDAMEVENELVSLTIEKPLKVKIDGERMECSNNKGEIILVLEKTKK